MAYYAGPQRNSVGTSILNVQPHLGPRQTWFRSLLDDKARVWTTIPIQNAIYLSTRSSSSSSITSRQIPRLYDIVMASQRSLLTAIFIPIFIISTEHSTRSVPSLLVPNTSSPLRIREARWIYFGLVLEPLSPVPILHIAHEYQIHGSVRGPGLHPHHSHNLRA